MRFFRALMLSLPFSLPAAEAPKPLSPPAYAIQHPKAPESLSAEFGYVSRAADLLAGVKLRWETAQAGTYRIKSYVVSFGDGRLSQTTALSAGAEEVEAFHAGVSEPLARTYVIQAVDAKGNSSGPSSPAYIDLSRIDPGLAGPLAPLGLTATPQRDSVKLLWSRPAQRLNPLSAYEVWREGPMEAARLLSVTAGTAFEDLSPPVKTLFSYRVLSLDDKGLRSPLSLSATGQATGSLAPSPPRGLTVTAKTEKAVLAWEAAAPGTAPVSAYILSRKAQGEDKAFSPLNLSRTSFTDSVDGDKDYAWTLAAVDTEGNSSEAARISAFVPAKPFSKNSILLMPTAFSGHKDRDTGRTLNVLFDFYVGSLYDTYTHPKTGKSSTGVFQPLQIGTVSLDLKYSFLPETWLSPALATGLYSSALINFGQPGSGQSIGASSAGGGILTLGDIYVVASKRLGHPRAAFHVGAMRGKIADDLVAAAKGVGAPDWEPTIRHLAPSGDFPNLLSRFLDPKLGATVRGSPHLLFAGIQFPATVPLGFAKWQTGLKLELLSPIFPEIPHATGESEEVVNSLMPLMVNFHIDNLPLFGFEFSVYQFQGGWQWIAFYHIPDLTWAW